LQLPAEIRNYPDEFYIGSNATTYDGNEHAQKLVVPKNTKINKNYKSVLNKLQCLEFDDERNVSDIFDPILKGVFFKIDANDIKALLKE
jgi:hypothetical protein